jgi:Uma2 family endonuclease
MSAVQLRRWTRDEYDRMIDAGVLTENDRVELIEGEIVTVTPQKSPHATAVQLAAAALRRAFGEGVEVRQQLPLALGDDSEPEPDIAVVIGSTRDYRDAHPTTALLILEVADSSLAFDRANKVRVYARAGIADYWLINLVDNVLEVRRFPAPSPDAPDQWGYAVVEQYRATDGVAPLERPQAPIAVADLLP